MWRVLLLVCVACDRVLGLSATIAADARIDQLVAPEPPVPCSGTLPALSTWTYTKASFPTYPYAGTSSLQATAFYDTAAAYLGDGTHVFDYSADGTLAEITQLAAMPNTEIPTLATSPHGEVLWFPRGATASGVYFSAVFYAVRARGWEVHEAELLLDPPFIAWPTSAASYAGTLRLALTIEDKIDTPFRMVELSSTDGYHWTDTHTLDGFANSAGPALSPDGCVLMFTHKYANDNPSPPQIYAAARDDATGGFSAEVMLTGAPAEPLWSEAPAIDVANSRFWYLHTASNTPGDHVLIQAHP